MLYRNIVISIFFLFLSLAASAQDAAWLKTISSNAVEKGAAGTFLPAKPGYALYFSNIGYLNVPYLVCIPRSYDPGKPTSLVVFLHGAILAKDSFQYKNPAIADEPIFSVADEYNAIVVFPFSRSDFKWSGGDPPAYNNVIKTIGLVREHYNVDKTKIFIGGISMGANAIPYFIYNKASVFAGFFMFSASAGAGIKYSVLTAEKPLISVNAKDDQVFSYSEVKAEYEQHKKEAPGWAFSTVESGGHRFIYGAGGKQIVKSVIGQLLRR